MPKKSSTSRLPTLGRINKEAFGDKLIESEKTLRSKWVFSKDNIIISLSDTIDVSIVNYRIGSIGVPKLVKNIILSARNIQELKEMKELKGWLSDEC